MKFVLFLADHVNLMVAGEPKGIRFRVISIFSPLRNGKSAPFTSIYASTMSHEDDSEEQFHDQFPTAILRVPMSNCIFLLRMILRLLLDVITQSGWASQHLIAFVIPMGTENAY